ETHTGSAATAASNAASRGRDAPSNVHHAADEERTAAPPRACARLHDGDPPSPWETWLPWALRAHLLQQRCAHLIGQTLCRLIGGRLHPSSSIGGGMGGFLDSAWRDRSVGRARRGNVVAAFPEGRTRFSVARSMGRQRRRGALALLRGLRLP